MRRAFFFLCHCLEEFDDELEVLKGYSVCEKETRVSQGLC